MQLTIKNPKAYAMAAELTRLTGESICQAVMQALEARLQAERGKVRPDLAERRAKILALVEEVKHLPVYDSRHPDEILYDEHGLPKPRTDGDSDRWSHRDVRGL
ncbi:MAG: type II toxin-antitoxin system VapB family antitoxin [Alphaproteobacteria bacterium]|nr:type II toxin-antitoxin system VapB family antitoxin [Alphaproteobacteria bacterium]